MAATNTRGAQTRDRILDAAWELVSGPGGADVTMADVARAAGVTRQLVYFHFESRGGLLVAMARHRDRVSGFRDRVADSRRLAPVEGFRRLLEEWLAYVPVILPVARALEAAAVTRDDAAAAAWRDRHADLREAFRLAVERLEAAQLLGAGWSVATAADWVWARTHLSTHHHLVVERGWDRERYAERTVRSILADVVAND